MQQDGIPSARPRTHSPDFVAGSDRKRRRKVLSCYDCRRRKLQCDRVMPACGRCTKAGQAGDCLYVDDATDVVASDRASGRGPFDGHISRPIQQAAAPVGDSLARLEYQERRIKQLEAALAHTGHTQTIDVVQQLKVSKLPLTPESMMATAEQTGGTVTDRETMLLRGKSFKTQFHGTTHPSSLIAHIPVSTPLIVRSVDIEQIGSLLTLATSFFQDLNSFTRDTFEKYPALARIRQDMHALEDRVEYAGTRPRTVTSEDLKALLPAKAQADQLIQLYLDNYGQIYHILHLPTFWQQYIFAPHQIFYVSFRLFRLQPVTFTEPIEIFWALRAPSYHIPWLYTANSSTAREKAVTSIQACDDWLQMQSQKHVTAADFQLRVLIHFSRQVSARKFKRRWTEAGTLMRFCMSAGLHRNPELLRKKTSALDKELRRRIWAAVVELELQAAFDRGMISAPWHMQADCPAPSNIQDEHMDQDTEQLALPLRPHDFTSSGYLSAASESTMLRHGLNTTLNNIRQTLSFDDIKRFTEEIDAQIQSIPKWTDAKADVPAALLSLNLRQYTLVLHDRQLRQAGTSAERSFSRVMIIDNSTRIIDTHRALISKGSYALELLCQDQLRAALSICHLTTTVDIRADSAIGQIIEHHADRVMTEAVQMLTDKVLRFGREQRQLWVALAAHGFWKARKDPAQRAVYMQEAVDKITRPWYKIMASQEDAPVGAGAPAADGGAPRAEMPGGGLEYLPPTTQAAAAGNLGGLFDLDEIEAWTLENWGAFDASDLQQLADMCQPNPP
ncbi:hypothetical protein LTR53_005220 [Teratosphaeriaceae sp. CCFEE 6253]|nr:hypothetical protein LTR53_005220 [Teratosphaeriaceae sp. CCFEE 6253]